MEKNDELEMNNINFAGYLKVARYAKYIIKELFFKVLLGLIITGTYVSQAVFLAHGIKTVFDGSSFGEVLLYFSLVVVCIVSRGFLVRYMEGYTKIVAGKMKMALREKIIGKLLLLGPGFQTDKRSGRFQSLVTDGVEYLEPYLVNYLPQVAVVFFSVVPMVIYIFLQSWLAGMIVAVAILLAVFMPHILMPLYVKACVGYWRQYATLNSQYIDTMQGMNTLKLFNAENRKGAELAAASEKFRLRQLTNTRHSLFSSGIIAMMIGVATSFAAGVSAYILADGQMSETVLLTIMFLVIECVRPIGELNNQWHCSMMGFSVSSELLDILDAPIIVKEKEHAAKDHIESGLPEICFKKVRFRYLAKREYALSDMNLVLKPGETAAVVGPSGAGKSTLVNLLLRFYDVEDGAIRINGEDIRDYSLDYLRSKIAVVFQNTYLFYGTVKDNISMAKPYASEAEIVAAAKAANAHDFIISLPRGYDTLVGERGDTLSGGQRQRIAIARAILKNAPILIMDEATSSVDAASEKLIQETMEQLKGQFTTIMIAHRLSTIRNAEQIYVFHEGTLAEKGTHEELLQQEGIYHQLTEAQSKGAVI